MLTNRRNWVREKRPGMHGGGGKLLQLSCLHLPIDNDFQLTTNIAAYLFKRLILINAPLRAQWSDFLFYRCEIPFKGEYYY